MPIDKELFNEYLFQIDQRITKLVTLRDRLRAIIELSDLLDDTVVESIVQSVKGELSGAAAEIHVVEMPQVRRKEP